MFKRTLEGEIKGSHHNGSESLSRKTGDDSSSHRKEDAPKKSKSTLVYGPHPEPKPTTPVKKGIQIKLNSQKISQPVSSVKSKSHTVAAIFNADEDDEPEEMPPEARMRMRNIGRETPTSAGPNSFGKTKQGFCDSKKIFEKNMKKAMDSTEGSDDTSQDV